MPRKNKALSVKLINNPGAGIPSESAANLEKATRNLIDLGFKVDVALAQPKIQAIPIARQAVRDGYDIIVAMGGDGTIGAVIRGIVGSKVRLGIIAAGTSNDIAASLGIPADIEEACRVIAAGHTRKIDLARISTKKVKDFYFPMVGAVGLSASLYPDIKDVPHGSFKDKVEGIKDAVATIIKAEPSPKVYLTLDNESKIQVETMLVTIANTPLAGLKNLVAPDASEADGLLDIAVYPGMSKPELLLYFAASANQGVIEDGRIRRYRARQIKIKTEPKLDIAADGIILGKGKATFKAVPHAVRLIAPRPGKGAEKPLTQSQAELPQPVSPKASKED
ncbi:MAG: diacylglycerol/lipid kinase family protein [Anaerolineae bacterium]